MGCSSTTWLTSCALKDPRAARDAVGDPSNMAWTASNSREEGEKPNDLRAGNGTQSGELGVASPLVAASLGDAAGAWLESLMAGNRDEEELSEARRVNGIQGGDSVLSTFSCDDDASPERICDDAAGGCAEGGAGGEDM